MPIRKEGKSHINNLSLQLLEQEEHNKPKTNRRKKIKVRIQINEMGNRETLGTINETKSTSLNRSVKLRNL